jgi:hypothetical protein
MPVALHTAADDLTVEDIEGGEQRVEVPMPLIVMHQGAGATLLPTHWTAGLRAKAVGVSSVQRIWQAHELQPHRVRRFKLSKDP